MSEQGRIAFEQAVLRLIAEGKGEWRWHNIAFGLSRMGMMTEHDLMHVFKDLLKRGLVRESFTPDHPHPLWDITEAGRAALKR